MTSNLTFSPANQLNNAYIIGQTKFQPAKFTDQNQLYNIYSRDSTTVYKGLLSLWNQRSIITTPLINLAELQNSVMYVPNTESRFRYSIPYDVGCPYIIENLERENPYPGRDGQPFKLKFNCNDYTNTDVITVDRMNGLQVVVTETEIYQEADGWVYEVELLSSSRRNIYYPHEYMEPGKQYMKIQNINTEYSTDKSSITTSSGWYDLETELGMGHRSVEHWMTGYADMTRLKDNNNDPKFARINQLLNSAGSVTLYANKDAKGRVIPNSVTWQYTVELLLRAEMEKMTENAYMWAQGGFVNQGRNRKKSKVASGLYPQLRNGNRITYPRNAMSLEFLENQIANLFAGSGVPVTERYTEIQTGQVGLDRVSRELNEKFAAANSYMIQAKDMPGGIVFGDIDNAGYRLPRFTQYYSHKAGWIRFKHNVALDYTHGKRHEDGMIGPYAASSSTYLIMDITDKSKTNATATINTKYRVENGFNDGNNIVLIKPDGYGDLYWGYEIGTQHPLGPSHMKGMYSSSSFDGWKIWMKSFGTIWVKDVTRTLLIEEARPDTGFFLP